MVTLCNSRSFLNDSFRSAYHNERYGKVVASKDSFIRGPAKGGRKLFHILMDGTPEELEEALYGTENINKRDA